MLEGADRDWSASTNQRIVNYANLKPGTYRFRVRAVNADGVVSNEPASVAFTIVPPVWQRWWSYHSAGFGFHRCNAPDL
jgi:predicted phage tail protein